MNHTAPNFSPIATSFQRKVPTERTREGSRKPLQSSSLATSAAAAAGDGANKPKYQCPGCAELFAKWSPCLAHLREKWHVEAELLDKRLNGGDFRRVQEMCATLVYQKRGGSGRERTDSGSSFDSLSSDSGGEEEDPMSISERGSTGGDRSSSGSSRRLKKFVPVGSSLTNVTSASSSTSPRTLTTKRLLKPLQRSSNLDLRKLDEKVIFRILTYLDVDSSRMLFLAVTLVPSITPPSAAASRVRLWSISSDAESASLPSASPQSLSYKRLPTPSASSRYEANW